MNETCRQNSLSVLSCVRYLVPVCVFSIPPVAHVHVESRTSHVLQGDYFSGIRKHHARAIFLDGLFFRIEVSLGKMCCSTRTGLYFAGEGRTCLPRFGFRLRSSHARATPHASALLLPIQSGESSSSFIRCSRVPLFCPGMLHM